MLHQITSKYPQIYLLDPSPRTAVVNNVRPLSTVTSNSFLDLWLEVHEWVQTVRNLAMAETLGQFFPNFGFHGGF